MTKEFAKSQAGQSKGVHEPRLVGEVSVDYLANSSEPLFCGIRQQLASGRLPNLARHLGATDSNMTGALKKKLDDQTSRFKLHPECCARLAEGLPLGYRPS